MPVLLLLSSSWPLPAHPQLVVGTHVLVVSLVHLQQCRPLFRVLPQQQPQKCNEIGLVAGGDFCRYDVFDDVEVDFGEAGVVAEGEGINEGEALEEDHSQSKSVAFIEIEFGGALTA